MNEFLQFNFQHEFLSVTIVHRFLLGHVSEWHLTIFFFAAVGVDDKSDKSAQMLVVYALTIPIPCAMAMLYSL